MRVLGIETSCDETGVAIYDTKAGLLAQALCSSSHLHQATGGVVPEIASRDHSRQLLPLVDSTLSQAEIQVHQIDAIAYTSGPGLAGAIMVGAALAKSLAFALDVPSLGVHHLEGHLRAAELDGCHLGYPCIALLVSGGHSHIYLVHQQCTYQLLGATRDDAAGEAFDKCANMLGLGYPGGAALAALASQGDAQRFTLPRPMRNKPGLDMSFSGLKTAVRYLLEELDNPPDAQTKADLAASVEAAIIDSLLAKLTRAVEQNAVHNVIVAGGVSANARLRSALDSQGWQLCYPTPELCTDNGAMIAYAGALRLQKGHADTHTAIAPRPVWPLGTP